MVLIPPTHTAWCLITQTHTVRCPSTTTAPFPHTHTHVYWWLAPTRPTGTWAASLSGSSRHRSPPPPSSWSDMTRPSPSSWRFPHTFASASRWPAVLAESPYIHWWCHRKDPCCWRILLSAKIDINLWYSKVRIDLGKFNLWNSFVKKHRYRSDTEFSSFVNSRDFHAINKHCC